jgi:predicted ATP-dependent serine protease
LLKSSLAHCKYANFIDCAKTIFYRTNDTNQATPLPGSMVMVVREATRPLLIELQALVDQSIGNPRRVSVGLDQNRLKIQNTIHHML